MNYENRGTIRWAGRVIALVLGSALAGTAFAHHSFAMYDQSKQETLTGKLTRFIPGANHAQLIFEVVGQDGKTQLGPDGKVVLWGIELGPAATIAQQGVTVEAFQPGTVITVTLNPLRNGKNFGAMASGARLIKCGMAIPTGGCTDKTGEIFLQSRDGFGTQRVQQPAQ
ncbi:MAG: DUF6152 family protein [Gammaproteobacteria bacterium]